MARFLTSGEYVFELFMAAISQALEPPTIPARFTARWPGVEGVFGAIAPARRADLLLLAADPLDDIRRARRIVGVVLNGR